MSVGASGFPDWQRITQWFGKPLAQATAFALGAGQRVEGPFNVRNWASLVICAHPVGGNVTVSVDQIVPTAAAALTVRQTFVVVAGNVHFESVVLLAGAATVTFQGSAGGETLDYAIVPSNVNTKAEVSTLAQLGFQHNDVAVANESAIDFEDAAGFVWTLTDDAANTRVKVTPPTPPGTLLAYAEANADVAVAAASTAAAPSDVVSSGAVVYDGSAVWVHFFCYRAVPNPVVAGTIGISLWDGVTDLGRIAYLQNPAAAELGWPVYVGRKLTPTAGSHTLKVRAWVAGTGAGTLRAGAGGVDIGLPIFVAVTKA